MYVEVLSYFLKTTDLRSHKQVSGWFAKVASQVEHSVPSVSRWNPGSKLQAWIVKNRSLPAVSGGAA